MRVCACVRACVCARACACASVCVPPIFLEQKVIYHGYF